ncbi:MAG: hypothetical protein BWY06_02344 [Candidatus Latescibacteria bacterium ADurb.Bin168]|nr:MAG: hypothetical protein BWY06_02344 [Candidatus Latescibacteria bacterium ADurb.Bin168]
MHLEHRGRRVGQCYIAGYERCPCAQADRERGICLVFEIGNREMSPVVNVRGALYGPVIGPGTHRVDPFLPVSAG